MRKKVAIEQERTFCDVCGKEMNQTPKIESIQNISNRVNYYYHKTIEVRMDFIGYYEENPKKDICMNCIEKAINKALEDLYKKG